MKGKTSLLALLICLLATAASAQQPQRDMKKEQEIQAQLKTIAPQAVATFQQATEAYDQNDFAKAAQLYEEVLKKAPNFDPAMRRLGGALIESGRIAEGFAMLEKAVAQKRSPENLITLAQYVAFSAADLPKPRLQSALAMATEAYQQAATPDETYLVIIGQLHLALEDELRFRETVRALVARYPNTLMTHYFSALVAAMDGDRKKAEGELREAEKLGLPKAEADRLIAGIQSAPPPHASGVGGILAAESSLWSYVQYSVYIVLVWALGLLLLFLFGKLMSQKTLNWIETSDPNQTTSADQAGLRRHYRRLINLAGAYYYLSLPVILFLTLAVAGSLIYGMLLQRYVLIKLVVIVGFGALVTIFAMLRSLFIRIKSEDPGRALTEEEAPKLWRLAREVAEHVGTRPVDEIRVTPGTEMAVYENGSFRERLNDRARRVLILGVGTLNDFRQNAFRAVLAHEYGHFSHRDTAGGDVALRVNQDMMKFAVVMAERGQAVTWNIAFQFLRLYHFIFRRISHGATRLQEILADRVAVKNYGAPAFEDGLRHVIRRTIELDDVAYWEITNAAKQGRALQNLYALNVLDDQKEVVEEKVNEAINRPASEDDTHPPAFERFRLAQRIQCERRLPEDALVWELFKNREALTSEMSAQISRQVFEAHGAAEQQA